MKHFKSAFKNYLLLNSFYTWYEYCNSNTATHQSQRKNQLWGPNILLFKRHLGLTPGVNQQQDEAHHYRIQYGLRDEWSYTSTAIYTCTVWTGKAFTELLFCHPTHRTVVNAVQPVGWPQGKSSFTELLQSRQMLTVNMVQQLTVRIMCTEHHCHKILCALQVMVHIPIYVCPTCKGISFQEQNGINYLHITALPTL